MDVERADWIPTAAAQALLRNNRPLLAYIGGKPDHFTSKDHNFRPGETVEKQLIVINNSRETVSCDCEWSLGLPQPVAGSKKLSVRTGEQERIPLRFELPAALAAGTYELTATRSLRQRRDAEGLLHHPRPAAPGRSAVGREDRPSRSEGRDGKLLAGLNVPVPDGGGDRGPVRLRRADRRQGGPDAGRAGAGRRPGARRAEGHRVRADARRSSKSVSASGWRSTACGRSSRACRIIRCWPDSRRTTCATGAARRRSCRRAWSTRLRPRYGPTVQWCGIDVPRAWRCGCRGNVASVLIEKPARGDFLPILDGGYGLQYSPLLEYREGKGMVLFCQMDVTGRTEGDPAADALTRNLLRYVSAWKPPPRRKALYVGDPAGKKHLEAAGLSPGRLREGGIDGRPRADRRAGRRQEAGRRRGGDRQVAQGGRPRAGARARRSGGRGVPAVPRSR